MSEIPCSTPHTSIPEDDIQQFLLEIRGIPRLTAEEERNLAMKSTEGNEDAIRQLVKANLRLVVHIAREYSGRGVPLLDLIQEGSIGLLAAARKFDYSLDYRFSTYATKWIRQGVTRCLLNSNRVIRVPVHTAEKIQKMKTIRSRLQQELHSEPSPAEIAAAMNLSEERVITLLKLDPDIISLDLTTGENDSNTISDLLEDLEVMQPHETLVRQELESAIQSMLSSLNDRQQRILKLHFGLENDRVHSLEEISKIIGISKERTRQIELQAISKLQKLGTSMGLEDFLNE